MSSLSSSSRTYLIGVDLGTSVIKTTLFDVDGKAIVDATRAASLHQPSPGIAEQNCNEFYAATLDTIAEAVEKSGITPTSVAAIAFDGQMAGAMGIDSNWKALTPWYPSALDTRCLSYVEKIQELAGDEVVALNGSLPFMAPRMMWWRDNVPDLYRRIAKVLVLANYVAGRMANLKAEEAFVDPSYLTWIGVSDTANRRWSAELAEIFDISLDKLPRIVPSTTVIGHLSADAAKRCGLVSGISLVAGAGDQVAGALGAGLVRNGQLVEVAGTFPVLATCVDHYFSDTRHGMLQPLAGPLSASHWYPMMYISGGGLTHRWFLDKFADDVKQQAAALGVSPFQLLDEQAVTIQPGAEGLLFIPHLVGRTCPNDPDVRGAWLGFTWTHERPHFYRALLESIAYDYAQALNVVREHLPDATFSEVRIIGGGAKSAIWTQIKADVLGLPYVLLPRQDVAALGTAIMGGHAVGIYPEMAATAEHFAPPGQRIEPRPAFHEHYKPYVRAYEEAFDDLHGIYNRLTPLSQQPFSTQR